jgi:hypothetical protein
MLLFAGAWLPASAQRSVGASVPGITNGTFAQSNIMTQGGGRGTLCDTISNLFTTDTANLYLNNAGWGFISGFL